MPKKRKRVDTISKNEVISLLTEEVNTGLGRKMFQNSHTRVLLEALKEVVLTTLQKGKGVRLGFITFEMREIKSRTRYNPKKRERFPAPNHKAVRALLPVELKKIKLPLEQEST